MKTSKGVSSVIQCLNCGAMNPDSARECEKCKEQLIPSETEVVIHETPKLPFIKRVPFRKQWNS